MKRIGLTGGFGSGKSTVLNMLQSIGAPVVDTDEIARAITLPGSTVLTRLRDRFGEDIFKSDGSLNRQALARHVFQQESELRALNSIMHPAIEAKMNIELAEKERTGAAWSIIDVPLLYESGWDHNMDATILVWAPVELCRRRLTEQRGFHTAEIDARLKTQWSINEKRKHADYIIDNSGTLEDTLKQSELLIKKLAKDFPRVP